MTQFSMPWETRTGTGDGAYSYNQDQAQAFFDFHNSNPATAGVLYGILNMLEVTGSSSPLQVDTGQAICGLTRYWNDAAENVAVTTPAADMGCAIVLQTDWSTNTTRIALKTSGSGVTTIPALTQVAGTTWEIYLATFVIDNAGAIWTDSTKATAGVTDARSYVINPGAGMVKLRHITQSVSGTLSIDYLQTDLSGLQIHLRGIRAVENVAGGAGPWFYDMRFNNNAGANYSWLTEHLAGGVVNQLTGTGSNEFQNVVLAPFLAGLAATTRDQMRAIIDIPIASPTNQVTASGITFMCRSTYINPSGPIYYQAQSSGFMATAINTPLTSIQILESVTYQLEPNLEAIVYGWR